MGFSGSGSGYFDAEVVTVFKQKWGFNSSNDAKKLSQSCNILVEKSLFPVYIHSLSAFLEDFRALINCKFCLKEIIRQNLVVVSYQALILVC